MEAQQIQEALERKERVDQIIASHVDVKKCISCGDPIQPGTPIVESIHGPYHGAPKTCVEGR